MTLSLVVGGLMTHDALIVAIAPAVAFFTVHLAMENLLVPAILGQRFDINPFLVFVAIISGRGCGVLSGRSSPFRCR